MHSLYYVLDWGYSSKESLVCWSKNRQQMGGGGEGCRHCPHPGAPVQSDGSHAQDGVGLGLIFPIGVEGEFPYP